MASKETNLSEKYTANPDHNDDVDVEPLTLPVCLCGGTVLNGGADEGVHDQVHVDCKQGRLTDAKWIRNEVARQIGIKEQNWDLFEIWVVSESLQLQMKANHLPIKVMKDWNSLLHNLTDHAGELPIMYFRRDCFLHVAVERSEDVHQDPKALEMFAHEFTHNVIYSVYPYKASVCAYLAGIHLRIASSFLQNGNIDINEETVHGILECAMPHHLVGHMSEKKWAAAVLKEEKKLAIPPQDTLKLHRLLMEYAWRDEMYGAVFFFGEIEPPHNANPCFERPNIHVRVGVDFDGIFIIDDHKNIVLEKVEFQHLEYNKYINSEGDRSFCFAQPARGTDGSPLVTSEGSPMMRNPDGSYINETIIWTRSAWLIDDLVTHYIRMTNKMAEELKKRTGQNFARLDAHHSSGAGVEAGSSGLADDDGINLSNHSFSAGNFQHAHER